MQILNFQNGWVLASFLAVFLLVAAICVYCIFLLKNYSVIKASIFYVTMLIAFQVSYLFELYILMIVLGAIILLSVIIIIIALFTKGNLHMLFDFGGSGKRKVTKVYNKELVFDEVTEAVISLSKKKIGALITFERNSPLDDYLVNGVEIDAPVSHQLLGTIFYPGTPLHDGAVIIRKNMVVAASVYFSPSTKPMRGKLGSRHRAAIGISEVSDAVTIVVSEETGRISITQNGAMEEVHIDQVYRSLEDYLG